MTCRGFTLIEMLLATVLASILMGAVLAGASALSRDRIRMETRQASEYSSAAIELIRKDLISSVAFVGRSTPDGFELISFNAIDPKSLLPNQRLVRIKYRLSRGILVRDQAYLDDSVRVDRFGDAVAIGVTRIDLTALSNDTLPVRISDDLTERLRAIDRAPAISQATQIPARLRLRIEYQNGAIDSDMVLR